MNISTNLKDLYPKVNSLLGEIDNELKDSIKKIKKDYLIMLTEEKIKFLKNICENEDLDFNDMVIKYLTEKERKFVKTQIIEIVNENLLDTININGTTYYYENKENGNIYNNVSKVIGNIKNGVPVMHA
jgi:hypothetical protein